MKALFVAHTAAPSGAELALWRLAAAMAQVDRAVVFTEPGPMVDRLRRSGVDVIEVAGAFESRKMTLDDKSISKLFTGVKSLAQLGWAIGGIAREIGATVIVAETTKALLMGAVASRRAKIPLIWHTHDRISEEYFGWLLAKVIRTLGWLVASGYIANSKSTLRSMATWRRPSVVAYPGVDLAHNRLAEPRAQRDSDNTEICVVGRLTSWKGQDVFLRAVAETKIRPTRIYLVGGTFFDEEPYRTELEALASTLDLPVVFTGHVDDPTEYMRASDILVHCSVKSEPFGQVVVEGMNAGCAVIASTPGGTTEIVEDGVNGVLVAGGDQQQLTRALDSLIGDRSLRQKLADAGPARAACFDIADSATGVEQFLRTLTTGAPDA